ncbi:MAG: CIA30 family protein [Halopseudomonas sp.]|uniref:CIA30 family protein n=1 Tax=Halopseudomonas sp. TaxID=2901191 RepID=UPI00300331E4
MKEALAVQGPAVAADRLTDLYQAHSDGAAPWTAITDQVMGGVSTAELEQEQRRGSACTCLRGRTSLKNDGGFVQMKHAVVPRASLAEYSGIFIELCGPAHEYELRVKTSQLSKPWQSFRSVLAVEPRWTRFVVPYAQLSAHRTDMAFDPAAICSLAIIAIGSEFDVNVCVRRLGFYR